MQPQQLSREYDEGRLVRARIGFIGFEPKNNKFTERYWFGECLHKEYGWVSIGHRPTPGLIYEYSSIIYAVRDMDLIGFESIEIRIDE